MAGFGDNLRREREMRGITLEEISSTTKISVRFLELLEAEEFSKLPGGIFIRSFIRSYANYLGLDEEQVMAEYQLVAPPQGGEDFSRLGVTGNSANKKNRAPVLPWIIAVILLAGGYAIFRYAHHSSEAPLGFGNPPPISKAVSASAKAAVNAPSVHPPQVLAAPQGDGSSAAPNPAATSASNGAAVNPVPSSKSAAANGTMAGLASAQTSQSNTPAAAAAGNGLTLQVVATEQAWVSVKADGKTALEQVMKPNDVRTLTAKSYFDVTTGNAEGTVLTLNGVTLGPLGRRGEVKVLHLTSDSLKNPNP
ncbi:MAG TPA: RodZ domain-containing protein [Terriglobia bacterium]|nr:RodZ domain-containing protein [Terriglobia bacterium]